MKIKSLKFYVRPVNWPPSMDLFLPLKNEPGFYCDTAENTARILEKINLKNVGANWDPGNANSAR